VSFLTSEPMQTKSPGFSQRQVERLLAGSGIEIGGLNPWDIQVHNQKFFKRVLMKGSLGLGESYMDGWWDCEQIDEMINRLIRGRVNSKKQFLVIPSVSCKLIYSTFKHGLGHFKLGKSTMMLEMIYTEVCWIREWSIPAVIGQILIIWMMHSLLNLI